jgi:hypothetical protein
MKPERTVTEWFVWPEHRPDKARVFASEVSAASYAAGQEGSWMIGRCIARGLNFEDAQRVVRDGRNRSGDEQASEQR